jgi:hypothetical protein
VELLTDVWEETCSVDEAFCEEAEVCSLLAGFVWQPVNADNKQQYRMMPGLTLIKNPSSFVRIRIARFKVPHKIERR